MGTSCPKLRATPKNVSLTGKDQANIADYVSIKNIPSFGRCRSLGYPPTAAATAANYGKLTPMPCVPGTCPKWQAIDKDSLICGEPALLEPATLKCVYGGTISIVNPRQSLEIKVRGVSFSQRSETQQEKAMQKIPEELLQEFNALDRERLSQQSVLDGVQMALDVAGMAPGVGAIPDLMNAAISVLRGDWVGAGLSIVAAVPGVGDVVGGAKIAYRGAKIAGKASAASAKAGKAAVKKSSNVIPMDSYRKSTNKTTNFDTSTDSESNVIHQSFDDLSKMRAKVSAKECKEEVRKVANSKDEFEGTSTKTTITNSIENVGGNGNLSRIQPVTSTSGLGNPTGGGNKGGFFHRNKKGTNGGENMLEKDKKRETESSYDINQEELYKKMREEEKQYNKTKNELMNDAKTRTHDHEHTFDKNG